jgi:hypothetical protein
MDTQESLRAAARHARAALRLAMAMQGRWAPEHIELLTGDVRGCRDAVEALGRLIDGDSALSGALLTVEEAQRQARREQLQQAIRGAARRHGWGAP